jgi:hypothetical protein
VGVNGSQRRRRIAERRRRLFDQPKVPPATEQTTRAVYRIGGVSIAAVGILCFVGAALSIALGPAPSAGEDYLRALAGHEALARINFVAFSLVDVLLVPAWLALYVALKTSSRGLLLIAGVCFAVNLVVDLGVTELTSFALVDYAGQYAAAANDAQRAAVLSVATDARAVLPAATMASFVVSSVGYLLASIATYRAAFRRAIGLVGIIGSIEGILAGFYVLIPVFAFLITPCLVTVGLWAIFVGIRLVRLTRRPRPAEGTRSESPVVAVPSVGSPRPR